MKQSSFLHGIECFLAGASLINQPGVRRFVVVPLLINTVLFSTVGWLLWSYLSGIVDSMLPSWLDWLYWLIVPLFMTVVLAVVFYSFTLLGNIIAAPFYGQLAKAIEEQLTGKTLDSGANESFMQSFLPMMGSELRKLGYYLIRAIPLLLLSLIPGVNVITLPLWLAFSAWFLLFEYAGYTFENHDILFKQQKAIVKRTQLNGVAFGGICLVATTVPIVNLVAPAMAVAGATKLLLERDELSNP